MRFFVKCLNCTRKFYISSPAKTRNELPQSFYLTCPICHQPSLYSPSQVFAETSDTNIMVGGALIGGLLGFLVSGTGALIGAILGGVIGKGREVQDSDAVSRFNTS